MVHRQNAGKEGPPRLNQDKAVCGAERDCAAEGQFGVAGHGMAPEMHPRPRPRPELRTQRGIPFRQLVGRACIFFFLSLSDQTFLSKTRRARPPSTRGSN